MKFLRQIASAFYKREGNSLSESCFVFPNRRAGLFFRNALAQEAKDPLFSPRIITIQELFVWLSDLKKVESPETLFRLYKSYLKVSGLNESFDDFCFWGEMLLGDFDETDKYLADAKNLFANIKELKELESDYSFLSPQQFEAVRSFWDNFFPSGGSESKSKFRAAWEILWPLYSDFRETLLSQGCGYEGMIYREVAGAFEGDLQRREKILKRLNEHSRYVFAGFNALTPCEKRLMQELRNMGIADFCWDYNNPFVKDPDNRASAFVKENIRMFPPELVVAEDSTGLPEFEVTSVPSATGQARVVKEILLRTGGGIDTAVILPDPSLLIPLLNSLPPNVESVNVTMGYPLRSASVVSLVSNIIDLQKGRRYYRRVLPVLRHNYVRTISGETAVTLVSKIVTENLVYVPDEEFKKDPLLTAVFCENINDISQYLISVLELINSSLSLSPMEREFNFAMLSLIEKLRDSKIEMNVDTYGRLLKKLISSTNIPLSGEPLSGLQVMGVLESRVLDFKTVIICSMNEGIFPKTPSMNSFIPVSLRKGFGLPGYEHWDTLAAYTFYRLLTGAENIYMIYDSRSEGLKSGEVSRFVHQLRYHYGVELNWKSVVYNLPHIDKKRIEIPKTEEIIASLHGFVFDPRGRLSASALNDYIECPLRFCLKYVKGVSEEKEVSEGIEADTFGSVFHKAAELLYSNFRGKQVTAEMLHSLASDEKNIHEITEKAFRIVTGTLEIKGRNFIVMTLIKRYLKQLLSYDSQRSPFIYFDSERKCTANLMLDDGNVLVIKGLLDRIDKEGDNLRIVDYKTGSSQLENLETDALFINSRKANRSVTFQMYLYAWILNNQGSDESNFPEKEKTDYRELSIVAYNLRNLASGNNLQLKVQREKLEEFELLLKKLIAEILNPQIPFAQLPDEDKCKYCPYNKICF